MSPLTIILIVAAFVTGGFVIYFAFFKRVKEMPSAPVPAQLDSPAFNKLDEWILAGLAKGYPPERLKEKLLIMGMSGEQFESDFNRVLAELNKK